MPRVNRNQLKDLLSDEQIEKIWEVGRRANIFDKVATPTLDTKLLAIRNSWKITSLTAEPYELFLPPILSPGLKEYEIVQEEFPGSLLVDMAIHNESVIDYIRRGIRLSFRGVPVGLRHIQSGKIVQLRLFDFSGEPNHPKADFVGLIKGFPAYDKHLMRLFVSAVKRPYNYTSPHIAKFKVLREQLIQHNLYVKGWSKFRTQQVALLKSTNLDQEVPWCSWHKDDAICTEYRQTFKIHHRDPNEIAQEILDSWTGRFHEIPLTILKLQVDGILST